VVDVIEIVLKVVFCHHCHSQIGKTLHCDYDLGQEHQNNRATQQDVTLKFPQPR